MAPESRVVGAGDLVDQPKKIALHYVRGYFLLDLFVVLPLPQVTVYSCEFCKMAQGQINTNHVYVAPATCITHSV